MTNTEIINVDQDKQIQVLKSLHAFDQTGSKIELPLPSNSNDSISLLKYNLQQAVFTDGGLDKIFNQIKEAVTNVLVDIDPNTKKGLAELKSLAHKIPKAKTPVKQAIEELKKTVNSTMIVQKEIISYLNGVLKNFEENINTLKEEVRAPVTAIEEKEKADKARKAEILQELKNCQSPIDMFGNFISSSDLEANLEKVKNLVPPDLQHESELIAAQQDAISILPRLIETAKSNEEAQTDKIKAQVYQDLLKNELARNGQNSVNTQIQNSISNNTESTSTPEKVETKPEKIILSLEKRKEISETVKPFFSQCGFDVTDPKEASKIKALMNLILNNQIPYIKLDI